MGNIALPMIQKKTAGNLSQKSSKRTKELKKSQNTMSKEVSAHILPPLVNYPGTI
jgi:hypothetical protein